MVALAVSTGIPPNVWIEQGDRTIVTAAVLLEKMKEAGNGG